MTLGSAYGASVGLLILFDLALLMRLSRFRTRFPTLREWDGPMLSSWPMVSVVVPCRNEAAGVETALLSLLA